MHYRKWFQGEAKTMKVTFVGVGAIGLPMALRIQRAGHEVTGVDVSAPAVANALSNGIKAVNVLSDAPAADVVVVMVATPDQLAGLIGQVKQSVRGQLWLIMSTVGPKSAHDQGEVLQHAGARVVDAPVTGGVARAKTGELVIFASGEPVDVANATPILEAMGTVRVTGQRLGDGQSIKVVNQHLCAVHIVAAAEALSLARCLGLDPATVLELVEKGAGGSWMLSDRGPRMVAGTDVEVTSAINIFVKDSGLVMSAGDSCGAQLPLLRIAHERFCLAAEAGLGSRDDSRVIETWSGLEH
jgi:3-hydroxyisobutyrate dehydrogenase-like beta-hydroxyacid dehydrogenase